MEQKKGGECSLENILPPMSSAIASQRSKVLWPYLYLFHFRCMLRLIQAVERSGNARAVKQGKNDKKHICRNAENRFAEHFNFLDVFHCLLLTLSLKGFEFDGLFLPWNRF